MKTKNKKSTGSYMDDVVFISCGNYGRYEIYDDVEPSIIEYHLKIAKKEGNTVRLVKRDTTCPVCGKPLSRNGYKTIHPNKIHTLELQKYIHRNCKNSSCIVSTESFKKKHYTYTKSIQIFAVEGNIKYKPYSEQVEEIARSMGVVVSEETMYRYDKDFSGETLEYMENIQLETMKRLGIKFSGIYSYDEQYYRVDGEVEVRLTLVDNHTKVILKEKTMKAKKLNNQTIKAFLEEALEGKPLEVIITDGRKGYMKIIEELGAKQHRCYFHVIQTLMKKLTPYVRKKNRRIKTIDSNVENKETEVEEIRAEKKKYPGRTPKSDKKTIKQEKNIKRLNKEIKGLKNEKRRIKKELKEIAYELKRVQNIWRKSKNLKNANRRFKLLYNSRRHLDKRIREFLEKIEPDLPLMLNHIENDAIAATNNVIENFYRTTLPGRIKKIYRTKEGLERRLRKERIRWTHRVVLKQKTIITHDLEYP